MATALELTVSTRVYGGDSPQETQVVAFPNPRLSLRDLIALKVRAELEKEQARREKPGPLPLSLRYLTDEDLAWAKGGAVKPRRRGPRDAQAESERAWDAFARKRFFVVVDGARVGDLDATLELTAETKIQFVRLLPLVGGQCWAG